MIPTTYTFCSLILPVKKTYGPWEMTVDNSKLNHVETSTATSAPDVDLFLEQINKSYGTWPELEIWQMLFISFSIRITRNSLISVCRATNMVAFTILHQGYINPPAQCRSLVHRDPDCFSLYKIPHKFIILMTLSRMDLLLKKSSYI